MKKKNQSFIIGIGGVSRAGKTELSNLLMTKFKNNGFSVEVIQQDDFVFPKNKIPKIHDEIDWESPESINYEVYQTAILESQKKGIEIIIAEGLLNFYDGSITNLFHKKIFIDISQKTFFQRKKQDTRWGKIPDWYINHIWESYQKYGRTIENSNADYLRVFGENKNSYLEVWNYVTQSKVLENRLLQEQ